MEVLDGKLVAGIIRAEVKEEIEKLNARPQLAVILVGDNDASNIYVRNKEKACEEVGIKSKIIRIPLEKVKDEYSIIKYIEELNVMRAYSGILCQLPLPQNLDESKVISSIAPYKDVDCFTKERIGELFLGKYKNVNIGPCTPSGIVRLLDYYKIPVEGKHVVVIGRSNIVGKPMAMLMLQKNATVTICHSKTRNLKDICKTADILISAVGKANFVTKDMVMPGAVIVDVGMNRDENGKLCGDVSRDAAEIASWMTPVPGGVGPMTVAMLMRNTLDLWKFQHGKL